MRALALIFLAACAGNQQPQLMPDPELTYLGHTLEPGLCESTVRLNFSLKNTRSQPLTMSKWSAQVTRNGDPVPEQEQPLSENIAPQGEAKLELPVKIRRDCGAGNFASKQTADALQISGKMFGNAGTDVVFEFEDRADLTTPKMPELTVDTTAQHYDEGRVEVFFTIKLRNPNPFPLLIDNLAYHLTVAGVAVAKGETWASESVGGKSVVSFEVPVKVEPQDKSPLAVLLRKPSFGYDLDAHMTTAGADYPMRTLAGEVLNLLGLLLLFAARAPEIALLHHPPAQLTGGENFVVSGTMVGASEVEHAEIRYRLKGDPSFAKVELELRQGEDYEGTVPKPRAGILEYYVVAFDFLGKGHDVFASAKKPQRVSVVAPAEPVLGGPAPNNFTPPPAAPPVVTTSEQPAASPMPTQTELEQRLVLEAETLLASGLLTVNDALQLVPDVSVSRGIDGRYHIAAMGRRDNASVLITLDGQPLNGSGTGSFDLDYPITLLDRITVSFGRVRAADTSAALVLIALESKHSQTKGEVAMRGVAGGYLSHLTAEKSKTVGTYDVAATGGGKSGALAISGRAAAFYSGGAQLTVASDALSGSTLTQTPGTTRDDQLRLVFGGTFDGTVSASSHLGIDIDAIYNQRGNYVGVYDLFAPQGTQRHFDLRARFYALGGDVSQVHYDIQLSYLRRALVDQALLAPPGYVTSDRNGDGAPEAFPAGVQENLHLEEHIIAADGRVDTVVAQSHRISARLTAAQHLFSDFAIDRNATTAGTATASAGAQDVARVPSSLTHRTEFSLAFGDTWRPASVLDLDFGARFSLASDVGIQGGDLPTILTPVGGITYRPLKELALRLSYDTAMRAPTVIERYERPLFEDHGVLGNMALRYTAGRTAAFDATYSRVTESLRYLAELRGFYNGARGEIVALDDASGAVQLTDQASIDTGGMSAFGRLGFLRHSSVALGVTWQRAYNRVSGSPLLTLLTDTPQLTAVLMCTFELGTWVDLFVGATYTGERRNDARTTAERAQIFRIPAQTVVNVQLRSRSFYGLRIMAIAHNAFDEARVDDPPRPDRIPGLVPREGFVALLGLEYGFASESKP